MADWATAAVFFGGIVVLCSLVGWACETWMFTDGKTDLPDAFTAEERAAYAAKNQAIREAWDNYPDGVDGEPSDWDIYNGYGREGGIPYDQEPAYDEHDHRL